MSAKKSLAAVLAVICCLAVLAGCGREKIGRAGGTLHMPLRHNRVIKFEFSEGTKVKEVVLTMQYLGGRASKLYSAEWQGMKEERMEFRGSENRVLCSTDQPRISPYPDGYLAEYRSIWIVEDLKPGDEWEDPDLGTVTVFAGFESVEVPAGRFEECYKTVTEGSQTLLDSLAAGRDRKELSEESYRQKLAEARQVYVRWFAPGIGLVKEQLGSPDRTLELVQVVNQGTGIVDSTAAVPDTNMLLSPETPSSESLEENETP